VLARVAMLEGMEMTAGQRQMVQLRLVEPLPLVLATGLWYAPIFRRKTRLAWPPLEAGEFSASATFGCAG